MDTHELLATNDAAVWAAEFMRLFGDRKQDIDWGLMVGWFANAMAAQEQSMTLEDIITWLAVRVVWFPNEASPLLLDAGVKLRQALELEQDGNS